MPPLTETPDITADGGEGLPTTTGSPLPPHLVIKTGKGLKSVHLTENKLCVVLLGHHLSLG